MFLDGFRHGRISCALLLVALAACGGGGDGDGGDGGGDTTFNCEGGGSVRITGNVDYEFVPAVPSGLNARLDFDNSGFRPVRQAQVQAICPDGSSVYASTFTNDAGEYGLDVPENVDVAIRVRARMESSGSPSWDVSVVDNTDDQAVWSAQGEDFDSATGSATVDLQIASGWGGSSYSGDRSAGPFAILDSVYTAMLRVIGADADVDFPALKLNWSPDNRACNGSAPYSDGCIGTSFFTRSGSNRNIYILGDAANDTDEYDNHVVIHEWGHYYEDALSRSDSIGGAHSGGDALDLRVAFGEGWGNAWSGIATDDPLYVDTFGTGGNGFSFDVENDGEGTNPGWWNEASVQEVLYDLYDADNDGADALALTFAPLHAVLTAGQRNTASVTSILSFLHFLKETTTDDLAIDAIAAEHGISTVTTQWGDDRTPDDDGSEFGALSGGKNASAYVTDVHTDLGALTDGENIEVCTHSDVDTASASVYNRLGVRRFLRFTAPAGSWSIDVDGAGGSDPDFYVTLSGELIAAAESATAGGETGSAALAAGETYVMEILDYNIASGVETGESCFDITFTN